MGTRPQEVKREKLKLSQREGETGAGVGRDGPPKERGAPNCQPSQCSLRSGLYLPASPLGQS